SFQGLNHHRGEGDGLRDPHRLIGQAPLRFLHHLLPDQDSGYGQGQDHHCANQQGDNMPQTELKSSESHRFSLPLAEKSIKSLSMIMIDGKRSTLYLANIQDSCSTKPIPKLIFDLSTQKPESHTRDNHP